MGFRCERSFVSSCFDASRSPQMIRHLNSQTMWRPFLMKSQIIVLILFLIVVKVVLLVIVLAIILVKYEILKLF